MIKNPSLLGRITNYSISRPWPVIVGWVVALVAAGFFTVQFLDEGLTTAQEFTDQPESEIAADLLSEHFGNEAATSSNEYVIISSKLDTPQPEAFQEVTTKLVGELRQQEVIEEVINFYETPFPSLVSADRSALLIPLSLKGEITEQEKSIEHIVEIATSFRDERFDIGVTGPVTISQNFTEVSEKDLRTGEIYGLPATLIILTIVFGAIVAALVPLALSIVAILIAIGTTALIGSQLSPFSFFVINMITMMGLAVGVDYSLFIVSRFREERLRGIEKKMAISIASATAGRAVLFSGLTVILALCGLFLVPMNIFQGLAAGAIFVVAAAVIAALTLLPAVLMLLGDRINRGRIGPEKTTIDVRGGFWDKITKSTMARPAVSLFGAVVFMLLLAYPMLDLRIGASGISSMPETLEARQAYDLMKEKFSVGLVSPATLVVTGPITSPEIQKSVAHFQQTLIGRSDFGPSIVTPSTDGSIVAIRFPINADATSERSEKLVEELRTDIVPTAFAGTDAVTYLGGESAGNHDFIELARNNTSRVFIFVLGLSFLLLLVVFRSVVVPIKAIVMNLLSVAAAYGLLTLVFQKGIGNELFGFQQVEKIEAWLPLFLFCVLFGLSMDYHVFLLSRIRERFMKTRDNTESVAFGVRTTASLITGAALIMVAVFAAFAAGDLVMFQQMGFGMAVAILLDATIIRSFLVPASMQLLGERNWYLPRVLSWLPNVSIEGEAHESKPKRRIRRTRRSR